MRLASILLVLLFPIISMGQGVTRRANNIIGQSYFQPPRVVVVPCQPNTVRTTGPNRGVNALPTWTYTPDKPRKRSRYNPKATGHIDQHKVIVPQIIINPYASANQK